MKLIVAIGGGNIENETTKSIDEYIVSKVNKNEKKVLLIPIASNDSAHYIEVFTNYYSKFDCKVDVLRLSSESNENLIRSKIFTADIIYIGGGNTSKMLRVFKRTKVNDFLKMAYEKGIIIAGISAGAAGLFTCCLSDANRSTNINNPLSIINGMGIVPFFMTPHYNNEERKQFDIEVSKIDKIGIAIEDDVAFVYEDEIIKVIKSNLNNNVFIFENNKKEIIKEQA